MSSQEPSVPYLHEAAHHAICGNRSPWNHQVLMTSTSECYQLKLMYVFLVLYKLSLPLCSC
jgi:hypothetical protein